MNIKQKIKKSLDKLPYIAQLRKEANTYKTLYPPGHFYSPYVSEEDFLKREEQIFNVQKEEIYGVALNEEKQLQLLEEIKKYYSEMPFKENKIVGFRYSFSKAMGMYSYSDAIILYSMIRHFQPKNIIEIGCGFSSAVMLDTNEHFCNSGIRCHFIDPHPERLLSLLKEDDRERHIIISRCVQDVKVEFFKQLNKNDIFFIDSSHIAKQGSDVNYIFYNILPLLNSGVIIHFHDIRYPFENPREAAFLRVAFNEIYTLRAFLQYNDRFEIILFDSFLVNYHRQWFVDNMPLCLKGESTSIWLRKKS